MAAKEHQVKSLITSFQKLSKHEQNDDDDMATIYKLPLVNRYKISEGVHEVTLDVPSHIKARSLTDKVVMLVGATGLGKTTLINRMINHFFDVQYKDKFRFQLAGTDELTQTQTQSQTIIITKYKIPPISSTMYPFNLIIIDTPGLGDTGGTIKDENHVDKIRQLFESEVIKSIHGICFVVRYDDKRLTPYQTKVFQCIASIFAKDTKDNIFVLATHCNKCYDNDEIIKPAPVLKMFDQQNIPYRACYPFNNSDLFDKPEEDPKNAERYDRDWDTSRISFRKFFEELDITIAISIKTTREILVKMHTINEVQLPFVFRKMQSYIHITKDYENDLEQIEKNYKEKDFSYTTPVTKTVYVDIKEAGIFCIECEKCKTVCHYPCNTSEKRSLRWCSAMSWFNVKLKIYCTVCKCSWTDHKRGTKRRVYETIHEKRTKSDLQKKYLDQKSKKEMDLKTECEKKLISAFTDILETYKTIQEFVKFIDDNNLSTGEQTVESIIKDKMESDENRQEDGWEQRKVFIEKLLKLSKENIDGIFHSANSQEKIEIAKRILHA